MKDVISSPRYFITEKTINDKYNAINGYLKNGIAPLSRKKRNVRLMTIISARN